MQSPATRALQHLILQGFTLYTSEAVDCMRAQGSVTLNDPTYAYAIVLSDGMVQCFWGGYQMLCELLPAQVRDARQKLETAVTLGLAPPTQALDAYPDEMIAREAKRRRLERNE